MLSTSSPPIFMGKVAVLQLLRQVHTFRIMQQSLFQNWYDGNMGYTHRRPCMYVKLIKMVYSTMFLYFSYIVEKGSWLFVRPFCCFHDKLYACMEKDVMRSCTIEYNLCIYTVSIPYLYVIFVNVGLVHGHVSLYYQANWILSWVDKKQPTVPRKMKTRLSLKI